MRGELKVAPTRIGADALAPDLAVEVAARDGSSQHLRVRSVRAHKGRLLLTFAEVADAQAAHAFVGARISIERAAAPLEAGEYFDDELIGCTLVDAAGADLGTVRAVEHYPGSDMLVIGPARVLVPLVGAFVRDVDIAARRIVVDLPPGLIDDRLAEPG